MLAARKAGPAVNPQLQHGEDEDGKKVYILQILQIGLCICVAFVLLQQLQYFT